jgi:phosphoribosylanthranilate isomerase
VSMHVCGSWARGLAFWSDLPSIRAFAQRIQINGTVTKLGPISCSALAKNRQVIFQLPRSLVFANALRRDNNISVAGLFDESGGDGVAPEHAPPPVDGMYCGYAGGIGPDNVVERIQAINAVCPNDFWIDMEGRVRTDDVLDMAKVRSVLKQASVFIAAQGRES